MVHPGLNADPRPQTRSSIGDPDHPVVNHPDPPSVEELHQVFISDGVPLAVSASRKAIAEAGLELEQIVSFAMIPIPARKDAVS